MMEYCFEYFLRYYLLLCYKLPLNLTGFKQQTFISQRFKSSLAGYFWFMFFLGNCNQDDSQASVMAWLVLEDLLIRWPTQMADGWSLSSWPGESLPWVVWYILYSSWFLSSQWSKRDSKEESVMPVKLHSQKLHTVTSTTTCLSDVSH